jgi:hypothetical protein
MTLVAQFEDMLDSATHRAPRYERADEGEGEPDATDLHENEIYKLIEEFGLGATRAIEKVGKVAVADAGGRWWSTIY